MLVFDCILERHPSCHSVCAASAKRNEKASRFIPWGFFYYSSILSALCRFHSRMYSAASGRVIGRSISSSSSRRLISVKHSL